MSGLSIKIRDAFEDFAICKNKAAEDLFAGRIMPAFVKHAILGMYSDDGSYNEEGIRKFLADNMPKDIGIDIKDKYGRRLLEGNPVSMITQITIYTDLRGGVVRFSLPDVSLDNKKSGVEMTVSPTLLKKSDLTDGSFWGIITLQYIRTDDKTPPCISLTGFESFNPFEDIDFEYFKSKREFFTTEEWIDVLLIVIGYEPSAFKTLESKLAILSRLVPAVEPNINFIELGPASTGKSYMYSNLSPYFRLINGKSTRAQLAYNHSTGRDGAIKKHDMIVFDEAGELKFDDQELAQFLRGYLESGRAFIGDHEIRSTCGLGMVGNIELTNDMEPVSEEYYRHIPKMFRDGIMLDRFDMFIKGWKIPSINDGQIYEGWTINSEIFAEYLHHMRTQPQYYKFFDEIVKYDKNTTYRRHREAIQNVATAFCKLLFPHVGDLGKLSEEDLNIFSKLYYTYCVLPAIEARATVYEQCKMLYPAYKNTPIPEFEQRNSCPEDSENQDNKLYNE